MTEDTMRANAQQDARMDAAIIEQKELWRARGYRVETGAVTFNGRTSYTVRVLPVAVYGKETRPHAWEPWYVYTTGQDERAVTIAALQKAAVKWPGVV